MVILGKHVFGAGTLAEAGPYLAHPLRVWVVGNSMIVVLLGLAAQLGNLAADKAEQALVDGLEITLVGEVLGRSRACLQVRRVEFGIEFVEDVGEDDPCAELIERLCCAI